jgi:membrane protease YdiL (CAAX protease family)
VDRVSRFILVWAPVTMLALAALVPEMRVAAAVLACAGWAVLHLRHRPEAIAWAAVLPLAVVLPWPLLLGADVPLGDPACTDPLSPIVLRRLVVAIAGLALVAALARVHGSSRAELGLQRPTGRVAGLALVACVAVAAAGLYVGPLLARPFFGPLDFPVPTTALLPALAFGIANGTLEEIQYRGAMQAWLGRVTSAWAALLAQGLVFGIVHAGPDVVALLPVHIALLGGAGVAAGILRRRSGSLWLPIGIHVGADIALYVGLACRTAA